MQFKDTIGIFDNVLSKTNCKRYIKRIEEAIKEGKAEQGKSLRGVNEEVKSSVDFNFMNFANNKDLKLTELITETFNNTLTNKYLNNFPYNDIFEHNSTIGGRSTYPLFNIQKYERQKGHYNAWHVEQGSLVTSNRAFVFILYLNNVELGGHTEFLFDDNGEYFKVKPKAGRLIIHPASWHIFLVKF